MRNTNVNPWVLLGCAIVIFALLTWVIIESWRSKVVEVPSRFSKEPIYRNLSPTRYWGILITYIFADLCALFAIYAAIRAATG